MSYVNQRVALADNFVSVNWISLASSTGIWYPETFSLPCHSVCFSPLKRARAKNVYRKKRKEKKISRRDKREKGTRGVSQRRESATRDESEINKKKKRKKRKRIARTGYTFRRCLSTGRHDLWRRTKNRGARTLHCRRSFSNTVNCISLDASALVAENPAMFHRAEPVR